MRRSTILLLLAMVAIPWPSRADDGPTRELDYIRRRAGFTQLAPEPTRIGVKPLDLSANLDGRPGDEIFTIEGTDSSYDLVTLTARHNGLPIWSRVLNGSAWLRLVPDVNADGAPEILVRERRHHQVQAFASADAIEHRIDMVSGRTGEAVWSIVRHIAEAWVGVGTAIFTDLPEPFPMLDATGDGVADVLLITQGAARDPQAFLDRNVRTTACVADGTTGIAATNCVVVQSTNGYGATILPVPDATGDGRPDVLAYAEVAGRPMLSMNETNGNFVWAAYPVDSRSVSRNPSIDYRAGGAPGRILLDPACGMLSCATDAIDAYDAKTGRYLWHRHGHGYAIGDVDGDGGSDLIARVTEPGGSSSSAVISSATGSTLYVPRMPVLPGLEGYRDPSGSGHQVIDDLDGDGILDSLMTWVYSPKASTVRQSAYLAIASRGRDGAEMWRQFVPQPPSSLRGDADGSGTRDLRNSYSTIPIHGSGFDLRDGSTYARLWTVGPFTGRDYAGDPVAADVDGHVGDELILSWRVDDDDDSTDDVDYLAAYGPAGRLWQVAITLEGSTPSA